MEPWASRERLETAVRPPQPELLLDRLGVTGSSPVAPTRNQVGCGTCGLLREASLVLEPGFSQDWPPRILGSPGIELLPSQWGDVFLAIREAELDPADFDRSQSVVARRTNRRAHAPIERLLPLGPHQPKSVSRFPVRPWVSTEVQRRRIRGAGTPSSFEFENGLATSGASLTPRTFGMLALEQQTERTLASLRRPERRTLRFSPDELADVRISLREIKELICRAGGADAADLEARVRLRRFAPPPLPSGQGFTFTWC
jgi:hypothetical protein